MRFSSKPKKRVAINITSLIDVLFLLLIFFMVTSTFLEHPGMRLDLPQASSGEAASAKRLILYVGPTDEVLFEGRIVPPDSLEAVMRRAAAETAERTLVLKADRDARHGTVIRVMNAAKKSGLERLVVGTREEQE